MATVEGVYYCNNTREIREGEEEWTGLKGKSLSLWKSIMKNKNFKKSVSEYNQSEVLKFGL